MDSENASRVAAAAGAFVATVAVPEGIGSQCQSKPDANESSVVFGSFKELDVGVNDEVEEADESLELATLLSPIIEEEDGEVEKFACGRVGRDSLAVDANDAIEVEKADNGGPKPGVFESMGHLLEVANEIGDEKVEDEMVSLTKVLAPAPEMSEGVPEVLAPPPEETEKILVPEVLATAPEKAETIPEVHAPAPEMSETVPEVLAPAPEKAEDTLLLQLKAFAMNKDGHKVIIEDNQFMPFLILCLTDSENPDYTFRALEICNLIGSNDGLRIKLGKVDYFLDGIKVAIRNEKLDPEIRDFASSIYQKVKSSIENQNKPKKLTKKLNSKPKPLGNSSIHNESLGQNHAAAEIGAGDENGKPKVGLGPTTAAGAKDNFKMIYYYLPMCIYKEKRVQVTQELLTLRGILSITYDLRRTLLVLKTKKFVSKDLVGQTIGKLGYEARIVSRKEADKAVMPAPSAPGPSSLLRSASTASSAHPDEPSNHSTNAYPPIDQDSELEGCDLSCSSEDEVEADAVARVDDQENSKPNGWLGTAKNLFQKSFFW